MELGQRSGVRDLSVDAGPPQVVVELGPKNGAARCGRRGLPHQLTGRESRSPDLDHSPRSGRDGRLGRDELFELGAELEDPFGAEQLR